MAKQAKQMGRPKKAEGAMRQVAIRFPVEMLDALDEMAAARIDRPDRAALIREVLAHEIDAWKRKK